MLKFDFLPYTPYVLLSSSFDSFRLCDRNTEIASSFGILSEIIFSVFSYIAFGILSSFTL